MLAKLGSHSNRSSGATWGGNTKHWFKPGGWRLSASHWQCQELGILKYLLSAGWLLDWFWVGEGWDAPDGKTPVSVLQLRTSLEPWQQ